MFGIVLASALVAAHIAGSRMRVSVFTAFDTFSFPALVKTLLVSARVALRVSQTLRSRVARRRLHYALCVVKLPHHAKNP